MNNWQIANLLLHSHPYFARACFLSPVRSFLSLAACEQLNQYVLVERSLLPAVRDDIARMCLWVVSKSSVISASVPPNAVIWRP